MWVAINNFVSNQAPRFLAEETAETLQSTTRMHWVLILANCWGVPITKNSDLSSFSLRLSVNIHERISSTQDSKALKAESSSIASLEQKEIYNCLQNSERQATATEQSETIYKCKVWIKGDLNKIPAEHRNPSWIFLKVHCAPKCTEKDQRGKIETTKGPCHGYQRSFPIVVAACHNPQYRKQPSDQGEEVKSHVVYPY